MEFAQLRTKPSYPNGAKKISGNYFGAAQKTKRRSIERRSYPLKDEVASSHRLDARIETRHATRGGILVDHAASTSALDVRLSRAQGGKCRLLVAGGDRLLDLLDRAAHSAAAGAVHGRASLGLTGALLGRLVSSQSSPFLGRARLYEPQRGGSTPTKRPILAVFPVAGALLGEGGHAFALVFGRAQPVKQPPLKGQAGRSVVSNAS